MAQFDRKSRTLVGPTGRLEIPEDDEVSYKLLMLIEGECEGLGPVQAAEKFGYSKQRYFQLRAAFGQRVRWRCTARNADPRRIIVGRPRSSAK